MKAFPKNILISFFKHGNIKQLIPNNVNLITQQMQEATVKQHLLGY